MKKNFVFLLVFSAAFVCGSAQAQDEKADFNQKWMAAEKKYSVEYLRKLEAENRREFVKLFFDLGKEYFENEDYPAALVSFKRVIQLEKEEREKEFTLLSGQYLEAIDNRIMGQVEVTCSKTCEKDLSRLKKGIEEILDQKTVSGGAASLISGAVARPDQSEVKPVAEKTVSDLEKQDDPKLAEIDKLKDEVLSQKKDLAKDKALMRLRLKKEILEAKNEIEKLLYDKKTREIADKRKAEERLITLRDLYKKKQYEPALKEAEEILVLDPQHQETKKIKAYIENILDRKKAKEERAKAKAEKKRLKQEAAFKRKQQIEEKKLKKKIGILLKNAEKDILDQKFVRAGNSLRQILSLDPENPEAQRFLEYIELKVKDFSPE